MWLIYIMNTKFLIIIQENGIPWVMNGKRLSQVMFFQFPKQVSCLVSVNVSSMHRSIAWNYYPLTKTHYQNKYTAKVFKSNGEDFLCGIRILMYCRLLHSVLPPIHLKGWWTIWEKAARDHWYLSQGTIFNHSSSVHFDVLTNIM